MPPKKSQPPGLGRTVSLVVDRLSPAGALLSNKDARVLLPSSEVPDGTNVGDCLDVFIYLDSSDQPLATRKSPLLELDEVAFLEVKDITHFGAFADWGMPKQLLVPRAEQTCDLALGDRHPFGLYIDDSGRLAGTMRVAERVKGTAHFEPNEWVRGEAWRFDPKIGLFVIIERRFVGLVPAQEPHNLKRGQAADFRVATVLADGKITLSLRGHALDERETDAHKILTVLRSGRRVRVGDHSSPDEIRALFGMSKKAFKRAVGLLLKGEKVSIDRDGNLLVPKRRRIVG